MQCSSPIIHYCCKSVASQRTSPTGGNHWPRLRWTLSVSQSSPRHAAMHPEALCDVDNPHAERAGAEGVVNKNLRKQEGKCARRGRATSSRARQLGPSSAERTVRNARAPSAFPTSLSTTVSPTRWRANAHSGGRDAHSCPPRLRPVPEGFRADGQGSPRLPREHTKSRALRSLLCRCCSDGHRCRLTIHGHFGFPHALGEARRNVDEQRQFQLDSSATKESTKTREREV